MKRATVLALVCLACLTCLFSCRVSAAAKDVDGFGWNELDFLAKGFYVRGYMDGFREAADCVGNKGSVIFLLYNEALKSQPELTWWVDTVDALYRRENKRYYSLSVPTIITAAAAIARNPNFSEQEIKDYLEKMLAAGK